MLLTTLRHVAYGFLMGSADLVPGVSGGTIALVLGIYERLVDSIRELSSALGRALRLDRRGSLAHLRRVQWSLVAPLVTGILGAVVTLSTFLSRQLEESPTLLAAGFFGLVVGSVYVAWKLIHSPNRSSTAIAIVVGLALFAALGLGKSGSVDSPSWPVFLGAGAIAICAMILPGISGSLILVLIGMYGPVLGAVNERDLGVVGVFVAGAIIGLSLFSQLLHWALEHHHDVMIAALIGLMAGSLRILWPWPDGVEGGTLGPPRDDWMVALLASAIGFGVVVLIARVSGRRSA